MRRLLALSSRSPRRYLSYGWVVAALASFACAESSVELCHAEPVSERFGSGRISNGTTLRCETRENQETLVLFEEEELTSPDGACMFHDVTGDFLVAHGVRVRSEQWCLTTTRRDETEPDVPHGLCLFREHRVDEALQIDVGCDSEVDHELVLERTVERTDGRVAEGSGLDLACEDQREHKQTRFRLVHLPDVEDDERVTPFERFERVCPGGDS